jgi:hypothetical protein
MKQEPAMEKNVTLAPEIYDQGVARARAEKLTPDEWLNEAISARLAREDTLVRFRAFTKQNQKDMFSLGAKPSDVEREIHDFRCSW